MEPDADVPPIPIGRSGRLEALALARAGGDHALLVRQEGAPRALLTADGAAGSEELVVTPLGQDLEVRVDGDALAIWLATGSSGPPPARVPAWASLIGLVVLLAVAAFAVIGSATVFSWLLDAVG
jgi:hypothetical protein